MLALRFFAPPLSLLIVLLIVLTTTWPAFAGPAYRPTIPLSISNQSVPLVSEGARDPALSRMTPQDEGDASRLTHEIKDLMGDLGRSKGLRRQEIITNLYRSYVALSYYLEDLNAGRIHGASRSNLTTKNLRTTRSRALQYARQAMKSAKGSAKASAHYHTLALQYALGQGRGNAARALAKLAQDRHLNGYLKRRTQFLSAMHALHYGGAEARRKAQTTLASLIPSLTRDGGIAARLAVARHLAGVNRKGHKVGTVDKKYRSYLWGANKRISHLSASQKTHVLNFTLAVWRRAETEWAKPPFDMGRYADQLAVKAIIERDALQRWKKGQESTAVRKMQVLSSSLRGSSYKASLDLRILSMQRYRYLQTKRARIYEQALLAASKTYLDPDVLGSGKSTAVEKTSQEINRRYHSFVKSELRRVRGAKVPFAQKSQAIKITQRYLSTLSDDKEIEIMKAQIADLYAESSKHRTAVRLYKELAAITVLKREVTYLTKAIASQHALAAWPIEAPWKTKTQRGDAGERAELLTLYEQLSSKRPNDWHVLAHLGLLQVHLGHGEKAFARWEAALAKNSRGKHAAEATGFMLVAYERSKKWDRLENLARLSLKQKISARHRGVRVSAFDALGLALLEGGKKALADGESAKAVEKLKEFVKHFQKSKRHDEGSFYLAKAYYQNGEFQVAIRSLQDFANRYSRSKYYRPALLTGGSWSEGLAYEDNTIFFFGRFLKRFPQDKEAPQVRESLLALYLGKQYYAGAIGVLQNQAQHEGSHAKIAAWAQIIELEWRAGSLPRAIKVADQLLAIRSAGVAARTVALSIKLKAATRSRNLAAIDRIRKQLEALGSQNQETLDAIGEARFILAETQSKSAVKGYFNLSLKNPVATLEKSYQEFKRARSRFFAVCSIGSNAFCVPALHTVARMGEAYARSIEDLTIQETLAKKVVDSFYARKQTILNDAVVTAQKADQRAYQTVNLGNTNPNWTQQVLWQNSTDWNFQRVSGDTGNGFVQWALRDDTQ